MLTQIQVRQFSAENEQGCWVWQRHTDKDGYGKWRGNGAHRFAHVAFIGEIPPGLQIDHLCRNRACVNPWHMEVVTKAVNQKRGLSGDLTTHCVRGHELNGSNLGTNKRGARVCRKCDVIRHKRAQS